jgi:uncharacterized spore protein YtfJ
MASGCECYAETVMAMNELVKELLEQLERLSNTGAVTGKVRKAGDTLVLPLTHVGIGFGAAIGEAEGRGNAEQDGGLDGAGAGGAAAVEPRAFVVVGPDGKCEMLALRRRKGALARKGIRLLAGPNADEEGSK